MEDKLKKKRIKESIIELVKGDITTQDTEAVVNGSDKRLTPGGGLAGAIHNAAGPELYEECEQCKQTGKLEVGESVLTSGYDLPANHVIHTVEPVYLKTKEAEILLRKSYRNTLKTASENGLKSVSIPALSTGSFGYPTREAAQIALDEIKKFLESDNRIEKIRIVLYSDEDYKTHADIIDDIVD